jgi:TatA/E family protein of Tat protein translocase
MIFLVALLLFGPRKMPEIGKSIGRALRELRRASNDFKRTVEEEVATEEIREVQRELQTTVAESREVFSGKVGGPAGAGTADRASAGSVQGSPESSVKTGQGASADTASGERPAVDETTGSSG